MTITAIMQHPTYRMMSDAAARMLITINHVHLNAIREVEGDNTMRLSHPKWHYYPISKHIYTRAINELMMLGWLVRVRPGEYVLSISFGGIQSPKPCIHCNRTGFVFQGVSHVR